MNPKSLVKQILIEKQNRDYKRRLAEKETSYGEWLEQMETRWKEEACLKRSEDAGNTEGDGLKNSFVCLLFAPGSRPDYFWKDVLRAFRENPQAECVYGDEDICQNGQYRNPWFKPDWSPELFDQCFCIGSFLVVRKASLENFVREYRGKIPEELISRGIETTENGNTVSIFNREEAEKLLHIYLDKSDIRNSADKVIHIPHILFHGSSPECQSDFQTESELNRLLHRFRVNSFVKDGQPGKEISVIIPSKDHPELVETCLGGLGRELTLEVVLVDNGSSEENRQKILRILEKAESESGLTCKYIYRPMEFNFSAMCNLGAAEASGELLLFLNDDVIISGENVLKMAAYADDSAVGAVGIKLLYPGNGKIQHAGIVNLPMGPVHKLQTLPGDGAYLYGYGKHRQNFLAVTAACLMCGQDKFDRLGGFYEGLAVAFNDVDLCYSLYESGYRNICLNDISAVHCESVSRGDDESPLKLKRLLSEKEKLYDRHPSLMGVDPFYSPHLGRDGLDVRIVPAYVNWKNKVETLNSRSFTESEKCREDACLLVRIEDVTNGRITGYGVVLGDDNSCYEKALLLEEVSTGTRYKALLEGQYRQDLVENMPDQKNVGLSGILAQLPEEAGGCLPCGEYRIGMYAKNRVTGLRLLNFTNRCITWS